jgi:hypothetical protein
VNRNGPEAQVWIEVFAQSLYPPVEYGLLPDPIAHASKMANRAVEEFNKRFSYVDTPNKSTDTPRAA